MFIEDKQFLKTYPKQFGRFFAQGGWRELNFRYSENAAGGYGPHFIHEPQTRNDVKNQLYSMFYELCKDFCKEHGIPFKKTLRVAINISFPNNIVSESGWHTDHQDIKEFNQLICYLEDATGNTFIKFDQETVEVLPEKGKIICFENLEHNHNYPDNGVRPVVVITFC